MLTLNDEIIIAWRRVPVEGIDTIKLAQLLDLLIQCFQLIILLMLALVGVVNALNAWADRFWDAYDTAIVGLRWRLCPVRAIPLG